MDKQNSTAIYMRVSTAIQKIDLQKVSRAVVGQIVKRVRNNGLAGTKFDQNNGFPVWDEKLAKETAEHAGIE